jgi:RNA polymerase sigma-70 factor (sigma-E family)
MMAAMESEAIAGPRTALEDLHRGHYRSLVRLASLLVDEVATCEELVQDAFVAVFRKPGLVRDQDKLPAYLRSAVLNGARSHLRARQVRDRAQPLRVVREPDSPEAGAVMADDQRAVLDALRDLPDRQRDVLVLRFYLDLSEAQIAETLGIKAGTVKTHVRRGLEALATTLEDQR